MREIQCIHAGENGFVVGSLPEPTMPHKEAILSALSEERLKPQNQYTLRVIQALESWLDSDDIRDFWDTYRVTP